MREVGKQYTNTKERMLHNKYKIKHLQIVRMLYNTLYEST